MKTTILKNPKSAIISPRITEKASIATTKSVYVFNVSDKATKPEIQNAVNLIYKIKPQKIRISKVASKRVFVRGKWGVKSGGKKAYVYLKKGQKLDIA